MKNTTTTLLAALIGGSLQLGAIVSFNDGVSHTIPGDAVFSNGDHIVVSGSGTSLTVNNGAVLESDTNSNSTALTFESGAGGTINGGTFTAGNANGGNRGAAAIQVAGSGNVTINGGTFTGSNVATGAGDGSGILVRNTGFTSITGGIFTGGGGNDVNGEQPGGETLGSGNGITNGLLSISGGTFTGGPDSFNAGFVLFRNYDVTVSGGTFNGSNSGSGFDAGAQANEYKLTIEGGTFNGQRGLNAAVDGAETEIHISGGDFQGSFVDVHFSESPFADHTGTIYLYAEDVTLDGNSISDGQILTTNGTLAGKYLNGDAFEWNFSNNDAVEFNLTSVPEPSTYAAIGGLLALGLAAWRRDKAKG